MTKSIYILAAIVLAGPFVRAGELPPGLPGLQDLAPAPAGESVIQRPDPQRVLAELSAELRLSAKQEERITAAVEKKSREFDKLLREYEEVSAEEKKWRYKSNELRYGMTSINKGMPDLIRDFLDDDQRQNFDAMLEAKNRPAQTRMKQEEAAAPGDTLRQGVPGEAQPVRKKKLVRRRKLPRPGAAAMPGDTLPQGVPAEEAPGFTMVDKEPAAPKRKKVLRKKAAAAGPQPGYAAVEPAGAAPTGKTAPEADEDAGSYP